MSSYSTAVLDCNNYYAQRDLLAIATFVVSYTHVNTSKRLNRDLDIHQLSHLSYDRN